MESQLLTPAPAPRIRIATAAVRDFLEVFKVRLRDRRFWIVQAMVLLVTICHALVETLEIAPHGSSIYFLPASLYLFPVLYASLNFGKEGAVPTAIWSAILSIPNILIWHHGFERVGETFQVGTVVFLAILVAMRVDREVSARRDAESQGLAHRISELKYRSLFDNAGQAIILFDESGVIHEANAAAIALFGPDFRDARGEPLLNTLESSDCCPLLSRCVAPVGPNSSRDFPYLSEEGEIWLEPVCTNVPGEGGKLVLAVFRDVTARRGLQSYAREIVRAQEDERQRIARDLHDVSLQAVVLLCRELDEAAEAVGGEQRAAAALAEARNVAEGIGAELRRFSRDLRPSVLDDLGLVPAIRTLVNEMTARSSIAGRLALVGTPARLPAAAEVALFRIVQESLRNAERHSAASHVTVRVAFNVDKVRLKVEDDGAGFSTPSRLNNLVESGRLGLLGMQERANLVGGECRITSSPGRGTRVEVSLPNIAAKAGGVGAAVACPEGAAASRGPGA